MAIHYTKTGEPVSPSRQRDWDSFIYDAGTCPGCGRSSFLFDRCPDCGKPMRRGRVKTVGSYVLLVLLAGLIIALAQAGLLLLTNFLQPTFRTAVVVLCIVIHLLALISIVYLLYRNRANMRLISVADLLREATAPRYHRLPSLQWRFLATFHNAYHLDLAWLEEASLSPAAGDRIHRDKLLGRSVWLSTICDCPRLASVRFRLLTRAPIAEGMDTDLNAIAQQFSLLEPRKLQSMFSRPEAIRTLCDCLQYDPLGLEAAFLPTYLSILHAYLRDTRNGIDGQLERNILQTLAYFGPEACEAAAPEMPQTPTVREAASVQNPVSYHISQISE